MFFRVVAVLREQGFHGIIEPDRLEQHGQLVGVIVVEIVRGSFSHSGSYGRFLGYYVRRFPGRPPAAGSFGRNRAAARPCPHGGDPFGHDDRQRTSLAELGGDVAVIGLLAERMGGVERRHDALLDLGP